MQAAVIQPVVDEQRPLMVEEGVGVGLTPGGPAGVCAPKRTGPLGSMGSIHFLKPSMYSKWSGWTPRMRTMKPLEPFVPID